MLVDICFVLVLAYGFFLGFTPKVSQGLSMIILVISSLVLALNMAPFITQFIADNYRVDSGVLFFVALVVSFLFSTMIIRLLMGYFQNFVKQDNMNLATNLSSGLVIGCLLLIGYGMLLYLGEQTNIIDKRTRKESVTYSFARQFPEKAKASVVSAKPMFEDFWEYISDSVEDNYKESKRRSKR